jgi:hypothetical protein
LAYNLSNNPFSVPPAGTQEQAPASPTAPAGQAATPAPATSDSPHSASLVRFRSCRWQQPAENGSAEFCTHREVKPYAGTTGFDPDAWCPDCQYYKLRRAPKKKPSEDYSY